MGNELGIGKLKLEFPMGVTNVFACAQVGRRRWGSGRRLRRFVPPGTTDGSTAWLWLVGAAALGASSASASGVPGVTEVVVILSGRIDRFLLLLDGRVKSNSI